MRGGKLRHRVTIQRRQESQSTSGEVSWLWYDWLEVWAHVKPATGDKYFTAAQIDSSQSIIVTVRWRKGYRTDQRVVFDREDGRYQIYDIDAVVEPGIGHRYIDLMCRMREADGFRSAK